MAIEKSTYRWIIYFLMGAVLLLLTILLTKACSGTKAAPDARPHLCEAPSPAPRAVFVCETNCDLHGFTQCVVSPYVDSAWAHIKDDGTVIFGKTEADCISIAESRGEEPDCYYWAADQL